MADNISSNRGAVQMPPEFPEVDSFVAMEYEQQTSGQKAPRKISIRFSENYLWLGSLTRRFIFQGIKYYVPFLAAGGALFAGILFATASFTAGLAALPFISTTAAALGTTSLAIAFSVGVAATFLSTLKFMIFSNSSTNQKVLEGINGDHMATARRAGWKMKLPWWKIRASVSTEIRPIKPDGTQRCLTKDSASIQIPITIQLRVCDAAMIVYNTQGRNEDIKNTGSHKLTSYAEALATATVLDATKAVVKSLTLEEFYERLDSISLIICKRVNKQLYEYGYEAVRINLNNPIIDEKLQKALDSAKASEYELIAARNQALARNANVVQHGEAVNKIVAQAVRNIIQYADERCQDGYDRQEALDIGFQTFVRFVDMQIGEKGNTYFTQQLINGLAKTGQNVSPAVAAQIVSQTSGAAEASAAPAATSNAAPVVPPPPAARPA